MNNALFQISIIFLLLLPYFAICQDLDKEDDRIVFSSLQWKTDTLGMNGYRAKMKHKMGSVYGKNKDEMKELLGEPDMKGKQNRQTYFIYFFEYYLSLNADLKTATQSKIDLQKDKSERFSLGSYLIFTFNKKGQVSEVHLLWQCG